MLLELAQWLAKDIRLFNVFSYITLRTVLAALTALVISFIVGPAMIRKLTAYKIGQSVRDDGPQTHLVKAGTPTMGGALILVSIAITTLLWADLTNRYIWIVLITTLGFGMIGWVDDYRKVVYRNPKGLSARAKLFWQSAIAILVALYLVLTAELPAQTTLIVPFFKQVAVPLGVAGFVALAYFVIVGTSNAVNLTDGLDGLAIMPTVMISSALAIFAYVAGHAVFAKYLGIPHIPQAGELAGLARTRERARVDPLEAPRGERCAQEPRLLAAGVGERDLTAARVAHGAAPLGLTVTDEDDLHGFSRRAVARPHRCRSSRGRAGTPR